MNYECCLPVLIVFANRKFPCECETVLRWREICLYRSVITRIESTYFKIKNSWVYREPPPSASPRTLWLIAPPVCWCINSFCGARSSARATASTYAHFRVNLLSSILHISFIEVFVIVDLVKESLYIRQHSTNLIKNDCKFVQLQKKDESFISVVTVR